MCGGLYSYSYQFTGEMWFGHPPRPKWTSRPATNETWAPFARVSGLYRSIADIADSLLQLRAWIICTGPDAGLGGRCAGLDAAAGWFCSRPSGSLVCTLIYFHFNKCFWGGVDCCWKKIFAWRHDSVFTILNGDDCLSLGVREFAWGMRAWECSFPKTCLPNDLLSQWLACLPNDLPEWLRMYRLEYNWVTRAAFYNILAYLYFNTPLLQLILEFYTLCESS